MRASEYELVVHPRNRNSASFLDDVRSFVERQKLVPIRFEGLVIDGGFRADLLVEGKLLIELKSVEKFSPVHAKQVLTYLRFLDLPVGLLMNFGADTFREGLRRVVNQHRNTGTSNLRINQP